MPQDAAEGSPAQPPPDPIEPPADWEHIGLYEAVKKAIYALPSRFESDLVIAGVLATDLFAFNTSLAATIEEQLVASLNRLRTVWDLDQKYALYDFERQPQTFPDVVLKTSAPGQEPRIILGVELKGWYVLAKEREPSFRYKVTPVVCAEADLLVVVPWVLSKVISGSPQVFTPFLMGAKHAAEYKNWYWEHGRDTAGDSGIRLSKATNRYPNKSDMISDKPVADGGNNYGRLARTGVMDAFVREVLDERLAGIPLSAWQKFLSMFTERKTADKIEKALDGMAGLLASQSSDRGALAAKLREMADLVQDQ